jgi:LPXTG-site transpeptidase (sortase) family protein
MSSPVTDMEAPIVDVNLAVCEEPTVFQSELAMPNITEPETEVDADSNKEPEGKNQPSRFSAVAVIMLLVLVAAIAYFIGKYGKKAIEKFIKPLCLMIIVATMSNIPNTAFASSLSQLPDYGFGRENAENIVHFDTYSVNGYSIQLNMVDSLQASQLSIGNIPHQYHDGELIGKLTVEKLGRAINIYEGESLASMNKGGGRFSFTGMNSGNTAIIGHNRGRTNGFFIFVKDLQQGDIITLDMGGITRNYAVTQTYIVTETDFSPLMQFGDNRLSLVTCLENQKNMRRIAVALQI